MFEAAISKQCKLRVLLWATFLLCTSYSRADTHYVWTNSPFSTPPYTNWATAAHVIQDAVDAAEDGDTVLVTNGIYNTGGGMVPAMTGDQTNRIAIGKAISVLSVNGPDSTIIWGLRGQGDAGVGEGAIRCAIVASNAFLVGFTLENGHSTRDINARYGRVGGGALVLGGTMSNCVIRSCGATLGGGIYCVNGSRIIWCTVEHCIAKGSEGGTQYSGAGGGIAAQSSSVEQCWVADNRAEITSAGGGVYLMQSLLKNCVITHNHAVGIGTTFNPRGGEGGGVYCGNSQMINCTIVGNAAGQEGGGVYTAPSFSWPTPEIIKTNLNCILYYNESPRFPNADLEALGTNTEIFAACCMIPAPVTTSCITNEPGIAGIRNPHLLPFSPCIDGGTPVGQMDVDIDGEPRLAGRTVDIGADEFAQHNQIGDIQISIDASDLRTAIDAPVTFRADIKGKVNRFWWNIEDDIKSLSASNVLATEMVWKGVGSYHVGLTAANNDVTNAASVSVAVLAPYTNYVSPTGAHVWPFLSLQNAASNIQDAVAAQVSGGVVCLDRGVYSVTQHVSLLKQVRVQGLFSASDTVVDGLATTRCFYLDHPQACVANLTISNGWSRGSGKAIYGGGVFIDAGVVANSTITDCRSGVSLQLGGSGGGAYLNQGGELFGCRIMHNRVEQGFGGGVYIYKGGAVRNSYIVANESVWSGGFHMRGGGTIENCVVAENRTVSGGSGGGGACDLGGALIQNCTIVLNVATSTGGIKFWDSGILRNSIVYDNTPDNLADLDGTLAAQNTCTVPDPGGTNMVTSPPIFKDAAQMDFRLAPSSPCIDAGVSTDNSAVDTDISGWPRTLNKVVDIGAHETAFFLGVNALLGGAIRGDGMHGMSSRLGEIGAIPSSTPYASSAKNGRSTAPSNVTDWVLVDLFGEDRKMITSQSAFVLHDGSVVSVDGGRSVLVEVSPNDLSFLVMRHRNHVTVMSAHPLAFTNELVTYDFTTGPEQYYGGTNACVQVGSNLWGMIPGDADGDGRITHVDWLIVSNSLGMTGYLQADLNLDGLVTTNELGATKTGPSPK